jgi:hypothetical protein
VVAVLVADADRLREFFEWQLVGQPDAIGVDPTGRIARRAAEGAFDVALAEVGVGGAVGQDAVHINPGVVPCFRAALEVHVERIPCDFQREAVVEHLVEENAVVSERSKEAGIVRLAAEGAARYDAPIVDSVVRWRHVDAGTIRLRKAV